MKKIYCTAFFLFCFLFISGMNTLKAQVRAGVKGGIDVIDNTISTDILRISNRMGYQIGGTIEALMPMTGLGLELSLLYGRKEYNVEQKLSDPTIFNYDYLSIPLSIKKRIDFTSMFGIFASAGAYANVRIEGGDLVVAFEKFKAKQFAAGVNASLGLRLLDNFDLGMYYRCELTDTFAEKSPTIDNLSKKKFQSWTVGLSYFF